VTGEGLVNDGTALVLYRFAVAAAVSGVFSLVHASIAFVLNVVLGYRLSDSSSVWLSNS
jgi:NhaP-type Na+/H+ or K+/H+ antiporter